MPSGSWQFEIGTIRCAVLTDGYFSYTAREFFPDAPAADLLRAGIGERIVCPYTCLLVQTGTRTILVDTGAGPGAPTAGAILPRLAVEGVRADDIDIVVLTHAHSDHIGGALDEGGRPVFRRARHIISEIEAEHNRRALWPFGRMIDAIDGETEIAPGLRAIPAPGHTAGHMAVMIGSNGERLLNLGDAASHPLHLKNPHWKNGFDWESETGVKTRRRLMERAEKEKARVMAFHFPFPSAGRVTAKEEGWEWKPGW